MVKTEAFVDEQSIDRSAIFLGTEGARLTLRKVRKSVRRSFRESSVMSSMVARGRKKDIERNKKEIKNIRRTYLVSHR